MEESTMGTTLDTLIQDQEENLVEVQKKFNFFFHDRKLLQLALVHSSFAFERLDCGRHNETLEFLGDAVLDLAVGHLLFNRFPNLREGKLTRIRSALVSENALADVARSVDLGKYLLLGRGEISSKGYEKSSILSCAYEAVIGAMFLDQGYPAVQEVVQQTFGPLLDQHGDQLTSADAKSMLQEHLQSLHNEGPRYLLEAEEGPAHSRIFIVSVHFRDQFLGSGQASSKKEAEQRAAATALRSLQEQQTVQAIQ
jgi:ribonuclease-3